MVQLPWRSRDRQVPAGRERARRIGPRRPSSHDSRRSPSATRQTGPGEAEQDTASGQPAPAPCASVVGRPGGERGPRARAARRRRRRPAAPSAAGARSALCAARGIRFGATGPTSVANPSPPRSPRSKPPRSYAGRGPLPAVVLEPEQDPRSVHRRPRPHTQGRRPPTVPEVQPDGRRRRRTAVSAQRLARPDRFLRAARPRRRAGSPGVPLAIPPPSSAISASHEQRRYRASRSA
jgi:hypothetical protein